MKTSISILKSKVDRKECIKLVEKTDADFIHVDVMDGKFVENTTLSSDEINELFKNTNKPLDIHLMVNSPIDYINSINLNNINNYTIHIELGSKIKNIIDYIHSLNIKVGLAINPTTDIKLLYPYLYETDIILIMGVTPGKGGQELIKSTIKTINSLIKLRNLCNYNYLISFDGGVNDNTIKLLKGLDIVVSGSYVCMSDNYQERIDKLK